MNGQTTRKQHYVRKKYLLPWTGKNGQLWASRKDKVFSSAPDNVLHERDFYQLEALSKEEEKLLQIFIGYNPVMENLNQGWLSDNQAVCLISQLLPGSPEVARKALIQIGEDLQSAIENEAEMQCYALLDGDCSFWKNEDDSISFLLYLCQQYFRSKNMRDRMIRLVDNLSKATGMKNINGERVWKVLQYVLMTNLAFNIGPRSGFHLIILENPTTLKLITGDQPIVNLCVDLEENGEPKKLIFYYPLSPTRAMVLTEEATESGIHYNLNEEEVDLLNRRIRDEMEYSIIADSRELIMRYLS